MIFYHTKYTGTKPKLSNKYYSLVVLCLVFCGCQNDANNKTWQVYGGNNAKTQYSSLKEIDTSNVTSLSIAWVYHTNDVGNNSQIQVNPIIIGKILFGVSPQLKLFAVDATTGKSKWVFDPVATPLEGTEGEAVSINVCRGVSYFKDDKGERIFYTAGSLLYCINAEDGKPMKYFGTNGAVDLHDGLDRDVKNLYVTSTTPGIIYKDLLVIGTRVAEEAGAAPGHIRAYDVHTGAIRWIFHTIPYPNEPGFETWEDKEAYKHIGGANPWAGFSLDEDKGILFAPIGSATYDFYGGKRKGNNLYANCVLALNAETGKRIWHFQTVHHDVWDRDPPSAPVLVNVVKDGRNVEAVLQATKTGFIFLLDRKTGIPLYPVNEIPVPSQSDLMGEKLSITQPVPTFFEPFVRQHFTESDLNTLVPDSSYEDIKKRFSTFKNGGLFTPPSKQGTLLVPGTLGGAEWGGSAFDQESGIIYINSNETSNIITMVDVKKDEAVSSNQSNLTVGKSLYITTCMGCHGPNRQGSGNYPSLIGVNTKYNEVAFTELLNSGRRMMPAFKQLVPAEKAAIASFILDLKVKQKELYISDNKPKDDYLQMPYTATGYNRFLTKEGYPANMPPWGTLNAVNLNTGKIIWKDTLGDYPEFKAKGIHTGCDNFGGPVVTAGGLLFIAATKDAKFRAFNKRNGKLLWETDLPAAGLATPAVYEVNGKQYVVIACGGGGKAKAKSGDAYVAFALPN
ncbi:MAG: PQQ-binding-like beta-propeller repeat protein [Pedobacter sp.]|nr:PQQ-binding-like beta-propeller repeat protein [Chitinophagaceae bacterium]